MKKRTTPDQRAAEPPIEYDFSHGVRGKYLERYHAARVNVVLEPDVAQSFPDSASVNAALRGILRQQAVDLRVRSKAPASRRRSKPGRGTLTQAG